MTIDDSSAVAPDVKTAVLSRVGSAQSEADLDEAVERCRLHKESFGHAYSAFRESYWQLCCEIRALADTGLWKLRTGSTATSWAQFVRDELQISVQTASNLYELAAKSSREEVLAISPARMLLILQAPEAKRAELKELARQGASKRVIEAATRDANREARTPEEQAREDVRAAKVRSKNKAKLGTIGKQLEADAKDRPPRPEPAILQTPTDLTLAVVPNHRVRVPIFFAARDAKGDFEPALVSPSTASEMKKQCLHAWTDLPNGTRLIFRLTTEAVDDKAARMILVMTPSRPE